MGLFGPPDIAKLEAKRNFKELAKAVLEDDAERRAQAKDAIARLGSAEVVTPLTEAADDASPGEAAVLDAAAALRAVGQPAADHLAVLTRTGSTEQKTAAAPFLARMGDEYGLAPLEELARSPATENRLLAGLALGTDGTPARIPALEQLYSDEEAAVRYTAVFSAARIEEPGARELLRRATGDPEEVVREAAEEALTMNAGSE